MLTKNDVEILKEIFVTKEEFKRQMDAMRIEVRSILIEIKSMVEMLEVKNHRTILTLHEQKLQKII